MSNFSQKGISLVLTVIILAIILAIVFGLTAILVGQLKMLKGIGDSVLALYAADTGIEQALKPVFQWVKYEINGGSPPANPPDSIYSDDLDDSNAEYEVEVFCCEVGEGDCRLSSCPSGVEDEDCQAAYFCIRSVGAYQKTKRAIQVEL